MKILKIYLYLLLPFIVSGCASSTSDNQYAYKDYYKGLPFNMPILSPPQFPDFVVSITEVGGIGDGRHTNTKAFEKAMTTLADKGGGTLFVASGIWLTGPITFRSNVNLYLDKGALILFSRNFNEYPLVETIFEGLDTRRCQSPISGRNLENIAITGYGTIDGSGDAWRPVKKQNVTESQWNSFIARGGVFKRSDYWFPTAKALRGDTVSDMNVPRHLQSEEEWLSVKDFLRPVMISFIECKNIFLHGVTFSNSPSWNLHPLMCENIIIDNIKVRNPSYAQNGDGLDLESCKNTIVVNSSFDVGDDGICIKSGKNEDGRKRARPTENVIIDNCIVFKGHGGFVVGSEMSGGVRNILVRNCQFLGTDAGIRFKSRRGRGGVVENIFVENITMNDITTDSFLFNLYYDGKSATEVLADGNASAILEKDIPPVSDQTPEFRNLHFKNITSANTRRAMLFNGLPEMNIRNIHLENIRISAKLGAEFAESKNIVLKNVAVYPLEGPAFTFHNVKNLNTKGLSYPDTLRHVALIKGNRNDAIWSLHKELGSHRILQLEEFDPSVDQ
ncbi:glycoside hydrolase family 28 protein [Geofilum sp. OHC36d9]|uniref:glycoside hydrolase family 28 protein n=1 Tax=Geofilum sp. OHC36d9 TaxID=3458413 RepID=UPI00403368C2